MKQPSFVLFILCLLQYFQTFCIPAYTIHLTPQQNSKPSHYFQKHNPTFQNQYISSYIPHTCKNWDKAQFIEYFSFHYSNVLASQRQILSLHHLYPNKGFIDAIKTLPAYKPYILALAKKIHRKFFTKLRFSLNGLKPIIYKLEKEIHYQEQQELIQKKNLERSVYVETTKVEQKKSFITNHLHLQNSELAMLEQTYKNNSSNKHHLQRYQSLKNYRTQVNTFYSRSHTISLTAQNNLQRYTHTKNNFQNCFGNQLQHDTYQEFVTISNNLAQCVQLRKYTDLERLAYQTTALGFDATDSGLIIQAYHLADFCHVILKCAKAVGEGVWQGGSNVANTVLHPIDTVLDIAYGIYTLISTVCRPGFDTLDITCTYFFNTDKAEEKWQASQERMRSACDAITLYFKQQEYTDFIRDGTALITEVLFTRKCLKNIKIFYSATKTKTAEYLKNPSKKFVLSTAEGIQIQIADESLLLFAENNTANVSTISKNILKVNNTKELFTLEFWKKVESHSVSTKFYYHDQPIYKIIKAIPNTKLKKGDLFYLDASHKNHIEVFRKNYQAKFVMGLDGIIDERKTNIALNQKRSIKKVCK